MWKCKKCNEDIDDQFDVCWNCGSDIEGRFALDAEGQAVLKEVKSDVELKNSRSRYPALKTIAGLFSIIAWIIGIVAIIIAIYLFDQGESGFVFGITFLVVGALNVLFVLAISELIMVLVDIEYNTRQKNKKK